VAAAKLRNVKSRRRARSLTPGWGGGSLDTTNPELAAWLREPQEFYALPLGDPDLIEVFKDTVRHAADIKKKTIELPTDLLVEIADALTRIRQKAGKPPKSWDVKARELFAIGGGRRRIRLLKSQGVPAGDARERVARELQRSPLFEKLALKTIKRRLEARKYRR
jgi:hypothetical protein